MLELFAGLQEAIFQEGPHLLGASLLAIAVGLVADRLVDTGVGARGIPLLCGLVGVYAGERLGETLRWHPGPSVAGHAVLPALLGTLGVAVAVKLVALGMAGPRR